jgi:AcrR family transcriptional regulator
VASSVPKDLSPRAREIVDVALDLLEEEGPDGLSMRRIAERVGIRAPSIYKHLPDKQALEAAIISTGFELQADAFEQAVLDAEDQFTALALAYRVFAKAHPHL